MSRRLGYHALGVLLAALACGSGATSQTPSSPVSSSDETFLLHGTVVNSVDGTPVRRALVQFVGEQSRAALTGTDGTFRFEALRTKDGILRVRKPGYFSAQELRPASVGELLVHIVAEMPPLELKLYPEAIVFGRLTNETGRPLEGMMVQLQRAGNRFGGSSRGDLPASVTNENGEYRIAELKPNSYLIVVSKNSGRSERMVRSLNRSGANSRSGYPTYFYPGVTDKSLATELHVTPGKQIQADMHLSPQPLYRVSGSVVGAKGEGPTMVFAVGRHDETPVSVAQLQPGSSEFVLEGVPAGNYVVAGVRPGSQGEMQIGLVDEQVTKNVEALTIALGEQLKVPVRVHSELRSDTREENADPTQAGANLLAFIRSDFPMEAEMVQVMPMRSKGGADSGYEVALDSGRYQAKVARVPNLYVASAKSGSTNLLKEDLIVTGASSVDAIEIELKDDGASVTGRVSKHGQPAMGMVLLIPENAPREGVSTAANSDGSFELSGLPPGNYIAIALEEGEDLEADDPATLEKVRGKGKSVALEPSSTTAIELEQERLEQ